MKKVLCFCDKIGVENVECGYRDVRRMKLHKSIINDSIAPTNEVLQNKSGQQQQENSEMTEEWNLGLRLGSQNVYTN